MRISTINISIREIAIKHPFLWSTSPDTILLVTYAICCSLFRYETSLHRADKQTMGKHKKLSLTGNTMQILWHEFSHNMAVWRIYQSNWQCKASILCTLILIHWYTRLHITCNWYPTAWGHYIIASLYRRIKSKLIFIYSTVTTAFPSW